MKFERRSFLMLSALPLAIALAAPAAHAARIGGPGHLYTMTNAAAGNDVLVYERGGHGALSLAQTVSTAGLGTGAGLGSQGAVTLSQDGNWLFVVNAGSGTVSTFSVGHKGLTLASTVPGGGADPVSVTEFDGIVYVLNGGVDGNVSGFRNEAGRLAPLADGVRPLSDASNVGPAEVLFDRFGRTLAVTEKATNRVTTYAARADGTLGQPVVTAAAGVTPFGFVFDVSDHLLSAEAGSSSLSSYKLVGIPATTPKVISGAVPNFQAAACWAAVTPDGRFAFTANAATPSISTYDVAPNGELALAYSLPEAAGAHPVDMAVSADGDTLFVLNTGNGTIASFGIGHRGALTPQATMTGLPLTANGLAID
jgi:6-phosphogluconolactonase (cycloisomerase 2 family)